MLTTSDEIKAAWLSHSRQLSIRVKVNDVTYGSEEITSLSFDSGSISGEVFQIGSTYMNSVQIIFPSIIDSIAEDLEVIPELGVMVNGSYEYTKLGHFYVDDFDRNKNNNTTSITATDKMRFMEGEYVSKLTYPKAYREVALDVANSAGVEVSVNSFASLGTATINKPEGYTHRQAISLIAQFEGGFASFNRNGELEIRRLAPTTFEITPESYLLKGFTKNESSYRIGGISVKTGEEETDVIRVGSTNGSQVELENKVMTQTLLNQMWELVKTLNYFPYELKWRGCPPLEAGDWIYVSDKDGTKYSVPNLSYSITFNGGMSAESKASTSSSSQATYKYRGSLRQKVDYLDSVLSANKWNSNYYDQTEPENPKEGDIWFKPNGQDTEIWVYKNVDGVLKWVMEISSAGDPDLIQAIEDAKKAGQDAQLAADQAKEKVAQAEVDITAANNKINSVQIDVNGLVSDVSTINANVITVTSKANDAYNKAAAVEGRTSTLETSVTGLTGRLTDVESTTGSTTKKLNELVVTVDGQKQTLATVTTTANNALSKANVLEETVDGVTRTIASVEGSIDSMGKPNLITDSDAFDFPNTEWTIKTAGSDKWSINKIDAYRGSYSIEFNREDATSDVWNGIILDMIPISKGQTFSGRAIRKIISRSSSDSAPMTIEFVDSNLKRITGIDVGGDYSSIGNWQELKIEDYECTYEDARYVPMILHVKRNGHFMFARPYLVASDKVGPYNSSSVSSSKINTITETVDGHTQLIASNKTTADSALSKATTAQLTADGVKTTVARVETTANDALIKATSVEQTASSIKFIVADITSGLGSPNLISNTEFIGLQDWNFKNANLWKIGSNRYDVYNGSNTLRLYRTGLTTTTWESALSNYISVEEGQAVSAGGVLYATGSDEMMPDGTLNIAIDFYPSIGGSRISTNSKSFDLSNPRSPQQLKIENITVPPGANYAVLAFHVSKNGNIFLAHPQFVKNSSVGVYTPSTASQSQIMQLSDEIDLRVEKDGVINAINVSTERGVVIAGEKITISGLTQIDTGVIKTAHIADAAITNAKIGNLAVSTAKIADAAITDAKIGSLSATKITTGTLNAANVNIINLNASNITTGTISGANLSINLATGEVLFSKGKIANNAGNFSLDIDADEYYSQGYVNGSNSEKAMTVLKSGTLRTAFEIDKSTGRVTSMLAVGNGGMTSYTPKSNSGTINPLSEVYDSNNQKTVDLNLGFTSDSSNTRYGFVSLELYKVTDGGTNSLSGMPYMQIDGKNQAFTISAQGSVDISTWYTMTLDAKRTNLNGGGDATSYGGLSLGNDSSGGRVWSLAIYNRTYAAGNGDICITTAGTLGRKTSARKYKADIRTANDVIAHAKEFLTIQPASWYDKKDYLNGTAVNRFYGFIADEFHEKGLTEVVYYGSEGQVEGLAYDRLTMYQNVILNDHEHEIQKLKQEVLDLQTKVQELEAA